jgi:hypothetical protein
MALKVALQTGRTGAPAVDGEAAENSDTWPWAFRHFWSFRVTTLGMSGGPPRSIVAGRAFADRASELGSGLILRICRGRREQMMEWPAAQCACRRSSARMKGWAIAGPGTLIQRG